MDKKDEGARTLAPDTEEGRLLFGAEDRFGIYQIKKEDFLIEYSFIGMERLQAKGLRVEKEHYDLVYTAELPDQEVSEAELLDAIYERFNLHHPEDYRAASVSVSDVIVLHRNGENRSHYVDVFGYAEIGDFLDGIALARNQAERKDVEKKEEAPVAAEASPGEDGFRMLGVGEETPFEVPEGKDYRTLSTEEMGKRFVKENEPPAKKKGQAKVRSDGGGKQRPSLRQRLEQKKRQAAQRNAGMAQAARKQGQRGD